MLGDGRVGIWCSTRTNWLAIRPSAALPVRVPPELVVVMLPETMMLFAAAIVIELV